MKKMFIAVAVVLALSAALVYLFRKDLTGLFYGSTDTSFEMGTRLNRTDGESMQTVAVGPQS